MDKRTSGRVRRVRTVRIAVTVMAALAMLGVQPTPARADTYGTAFFPAHWGPNPYVGTLPPENPYYRSIYLVDNTNDPSLTQHIGTMAQIMNYLHINYNANFPVVLYYNNFHFAPGDPCAKGPAQVLVVCKDESLGGTGSAGAPGTAEVFPGPANHIFFAVARFRPSVVDPWCAGDKFTVVVQLISNALGLDQNLSNPASALFPTIPIGRCTLTGWTQSDLDRMNLMYNHFSG